MGGAGHLRCFYAMRPFANFSEARKCEKRLLTYLKAHAHIQLLGQPNSRRGRSRSRSQLLPKGGHTEAGWMASDRLAEVSSRHGFRLVPLEHGDALSLRQHLRDHEQFIAGLHLGMLVGQEELTMERLLDLP